MRHRIAILSKHDPDPVERGLVHYEGIDLIGTQTLCGRGDYPSWGWEFTRKRVNCPDCIAVRNHVLDRQL